MAVSKAKAREAAKKEVIARLKTDIEFKMQYLKDSKKTLKSYKLEETELYYVIGAVSCAIQSEAAKGKANRPKRCLFSVTCPEPTPV